MSDGKAELTKTNENIYHKREVLESLSKWQCNSAVMMPNMVIKPTNSDAVQKIVEWANKTGTPLITVSSGAPHIHGNKVLERQGSVIVDLSEMKKIIEIDRRQRMAIIEPGVTYSELQSALAEKGMRLSTSLAPRKNKSVISSLLEVEPRLNPRYQWTYFDPLRCMEVVWGDGNKLWTGEAGSGAMDLEKQWAEEKRQSNGIGPVQLDFCRLLTAAQGTMGIVTWASVKCELLPQVEKTKFAASDKPDDLIPLIYKILKIRFADELFIMNGTYMATLLAKSATEIEPLMTKLPRWASVINIAGRDMLPEERVEAQEKDIAEFAEQYNLKLEDSLGGLSGESTMRSITNSSEESYWKLRYKGGVQEIFFVTTLNRTPEFIKMMYSLAEEAGFVKTDIGVYLQPLHMGTCCHCEFGLPYDPRSKIEVDKARALYVKASEAFFEMGAYFSRPYGIWSKMVFDKDTQTAKTLKKLKSIFDPQNIMNPGKLSIF